MLSPFQQKKMVALFGMFDADGNGVIEQADFVKVGQNIADARQMKAGSPERTRVVGKYQGAWTALHKLADANKDGAISKDEWLTALTGVIGSQASYDSVVAMLADLVFETFDTDGDNYVQATEFAAFVKAHEVPNASPAVAFARLDSDGDGKLSRSDVMRLTGEYFRSNDTSAPGNALFGQV